MERLPRKHNRLTVFACAFGVYLALAAAQSWPLPAHFSTHFTGEPRGDTGVYVWNLWIFHHELMGAGNTPFRTTQILPLDGPADLSLHNYTVVSDVLALPLLSWLGIVRTFNLIYLLNAALAGFGAFLLIRRLTNRPIEAFVGGLLFMWSPFLVTRGAGHFSLVSAAPLPVFMLMLYRAWDTQRLRHAAVVGLVIAWAAFSDPYYAVYCLMLGTCFLVSRLWEVSLVRRPIAELRAAKHLVTVAIAALACLVLVINVFGGGQIALGPVSISMRTLYTPMLALTLLIALRAWLSADMRIKRMPLPSRRWLMRSALTAGVTTVFLMSPVLSALAPRLVEGGMVAAPVMWRSSAPGVDVLSFFIPNPNHAFMPAAVRDWLSKGTVGYVEQVASLSLVGLLLILAARRLAAFRLPRFWMWITIGFGLLALGPFIVVGHESTFIPTPWTLLRYFPIIGAARVPARFDVVVMLGFAVLVSMALVALVNRYPARRRLILAGSAALLMFELFPAPRTLYSAAVPRVYQMVAADPRPVRVLRLPTGIKDGVSDLGNFGPQAQYYQTFHGKGLVGGYLSRVDQSAKEFYRGIPVMNALMQLSAGNRLERSQIEAAEKSAETFVRGSRIGYVAWRTSVITPELRGFATRVLGLVKVIELDGYELYAPRVMVAPSGLLPELRFSSHPQTLVPFPGLCHQRLEPFVAAKACEHRVVQRQEPIVDEPAGDRVLQPFQGLV